MEVVEEKQQVFLEPLSPTAQYISNSILSLSIISVLEFEVPIDDSLLFSFVRDSLVHINPRFSSIMVEDKTGKKRWKRLNNVDIEQHVKIPTFTQQTFTALYDDQLNEYISNIALEEFQPNKPFWEVHIIKYPTIHAPYSLIFKIHHSIGDGYSLMIALLSGLRKADDPNSLPSILARRAQGARVDGDNENVIKRAGKMIFSSIYKSVSSFYSGFVDNSLVKVEDDLSPIRSGHSRVEHLPVTAVTMTFSLDQIKQIKAKLGATVNDVVTGTIFLGIRLYMEEEKKESGNARSTSLVMLNTRMSGGHKSVQEIRVKPNNYNSDQFPWGNHFTFLSVSIPKLGDEDAKKDMEPLKFVREVSKIIKKKRSTYAVNFTAGYLKLLEKFKGPQAVSKYLYEEVLKNTSMGISNVIGPTEKMALLNHPLKGLYFMVTGSPYSIVMGIVSYVGKLRIAMLVEKDFVNPQKLTSHIHNAFHLILEAASQAPNDLNN